MRFKAQDVRVGFMERRIATDSKVTEVILSSMGIHTRVDLPYLFNVAEHLDQIEHNQRH